MAKPNYQYDKKQREMKKSKQQEEKRLEKQARKESLDKPENTGDDQQPV